MNLNLLEIVKATQCAALACYDFIGKGREKLADQAAVDAMRKCFNDMALSAKIVIGEGERDEAPMLYIGEKVGLLSSEPAKFDIAVDPLEGTTICARNMPGSLSVMAISENDSMLNAPDVYMDKIASYIPFKYEAVDLDQSIADNLRNIALYKKSPIDELEVIVLNRARHEETIAKIREAGARITLIEDGDIAAVIAVAMKKADLYLGIGGAPEGVLAAAALKTLGGQMSGRLSFYSEAERNRAIALGITDFQKKYYLDDLVKKDVIFCATGVTSGSLLKGVVKKENFAITESLILSSYNRQSLKIRSENYS
jgi:fructose-1,6-bisphosphatase II / sedoheptulose-1,7-bisphosphatase